MEDDGEDGMFLDFYGKTVSRFLFVYFNYVFLHQYQLNWCTCNKRT
jgi:hypothetical protein